MNRRHERTNGFPVTELPSRRGVATVWIILAVPAVLALFCLVVDIGNLWLARVELENALEASALAAVKEWGDAGGGDTLIPRQVGVDYAAANTILGTPLGIATNYDSDALPNQNDTCDGNLIFGAITTEEPPFVFNAGIEPSCGLGTVFIDVTKPDAGSKGANAATNDRILGIFFDEAPPNLSIRSVSFTMPILGPNVNQQPFWDSDKPILVSNDVVGADALNRFNPDPEPKDVRGLDPDPVSGTDHWLCPFPPPPVVNPNGDICFTVTDQVPKDDNRFRTLTIHFKDGAFTSTNDPDTTDFVRFGASVNQLNPPAIPGPNSKNDGEGFRKAPVQVAVVFFNSATGTTDVCTTVFVDDGDPDNGRAIALCSGAGGRPFAVRAQATVQVKSLWKEICGIPLGPYDISTKSTAFYDCDDQRPRLIHISEFICPGP